MRGLTPIGGRDYEGRSICFLAILVCLSASPALAGGVDVVVSNGSSDMNVNASDSGIVNPGNIVTGDNSDSVQGDAVANGASSAEAAGIVNEEVSAGAIDTGPGDDRVSGSGNAQAHGRGGRALSFGITNINRQNPAAGVGTIDTGGGGDVIDGRAVANGRDEVGAYGFLTGEVFTRGGSDRIIGTATSTGETTTEARGVSVGQSDVDDDTISGGGSEPPLIPAEIGLMETGGGADVVNGSASVTVTGRGDQGIFFAGANGIVVDGPTEAEVFWMFGSPPLDVDPFELTTGTLDTGAGGDELNANVILNVSGETNLFEDDDLEIIGDGIENAGTVLLGNGNDVVNSTVSVTSTISRAKGLADALDNSSVGIITGLGLEVNDATLFDMGPGNDRFTSNIFASAVDDLAAADGLGNRGVFVAGDGNDSFDLTSRSVHLRQLPFNDSALDDEQPEGIADGWENRNKVCLDDAVFDQGLGQYVCEGGSGDDSVKANATASGNGVLTIAEGIESRELFDAGGGNDFFDLTALAVSDAFGEGRAVALDPRNITQAAGFQTEQIDEGDLFLGEGDDTIRVGSRDEATDEVLSAGATALSKGQNLGTFAFGVTQVTADAFNSVSERDPDFDPEKDNGLIDTGAGADILDGIARSTGGNDVDAFGLLFTNADSGSGADVLKGDAQAVLDKNPPFVGLRSAVAKPSADAIGIGVGVSGNARLPQEAGTLLTGRDGDIIDGTADAQDVGGIGAVSAFGIFVADKSVLKTQGGADQITARATTSPGGAAFDIGGRGTIDTGPANDTIVTEVDVTIVDVNSFGGGIRIRMGGGDDRVFGYGHAHMDGGAGANDELAFGFSRDAFHSAGGRVSADCVANKIKFNVRGVTLKAANFERFVFAGVPFACTDL